MNCIENELSQAEQHCQNSGMRLTKKRKQVLAVLLNLNKAASAYEILDSYKQTHGEALPPMSIYRILDFLEQAHIVHKLQVANKYVACSHIDCQKHHQASQFFICKVCDKVEEVSIAPETFNELRDKGKEAGFHVDVPQLEINCICVNCG